MTPIRTLRFAAAAALLTGITAFQVRASYTAPAGARVSLRLTARDTHGATVTETILGAYQTA